jgi:hypothetical protein
MAFRSRVRAPPSRVAAWRAIRPVELDDLAQHLLDRVEAVGEAAIFGHQHVFDAEEAGDPHLYGAAAVALDQGDFGDAGAPVALRDQMVADMAVETLAQIEFGEGLKHRGLAAAMTDLGKNRDRSVKQPVNVGMKARSDPRIVAFAKGILKVGDHTPRVIG